MIIELCVIIAAFQAAVQGSPFELVENYIEDFNKNLDELRSYLTAKRVSYRHTDNVYLNEDHIEDAGEYDFIIIGGGTSGSVLANRLSEIPEWKVLVLEAGNGENVATKVPAMHRCLKSEGSPFTWGYYSTPQNYSCFNQGEKRCFIPTAKMLGGTTALNDMLYTRGNSRDYDLWADTGLKGWCIASLIPYFKNIEDAHLSTKTDYECHRYGGPVHLESPRYHSEVSNQILDGAKEIDVPEIDLNGKHSLGLACPQLMTKHGERFSAADAYLKPALKRENLKIVPESHVTKILISEHSKEARGVQYIHKNRLFSASASKEIILAAGTINTAKLLLLSGVGPEKDLKQLHIEPVQDLQVGQHLIHHAMFPDLSYLCDLNVSGHEPFYYSKEIDYLRNGGGPLAYTGLDLVGFIKTEYSKGRHLYPDVELLINTEKLQPEADKRKVTINLVLLHPKSRGTLQLHSKHPDDQPLINLNDFSDAHEEDVETILSAIRYVQKLLNTHHLQNLHRQDKFVPNCTAYELDSDDYWRCAIKHSSVSFGEVSGSAPMGIETDGHYGHSVVDSKLRVHGIEKLRVADDSVIPVSISGQLAAIKMVIGEKCADILKDEWAKPN